MKSTPFFRLVETADVGDLGLGVVRDWVIESLGRFDPFKKGVLLEFSDVVVDLQEEIVDELL